MKMYTEMKKVHWSNSPIINLPPDNVVIEVTSFEPPESLITDSTCGSRIIPLFREERKHKN